MSRTVARNRSRPTSVFPCRERLRDEYVRSQKSQRFEAVKPYLLDDPEPGAYAEIAKSLGMSQSNVGTMVQRIRQRFGYLFRDEIAQTVADPTQIDDEIRYLLTALV